MSIRGKAYIVGAYEHPTRLAPDKSVAQLHAEAARGALADAGLSKDDVDGYFCAGDAPGLGPLSMVDYMGLKVRHVDSTDTGGSAYLAHVSHAAQAIAAGGDLTALVCVAGASGPGRLADLPVEQWDLTFHLNTRSVWLLARAARESLLRTRGSITWTTTSPRSTSTHSASRSPSTPSGMTSSFLANFTTSSAIDFTWRVEVPEAMTR